MGVAIVQSTGVQRSGGSSSDLTLSFPLATNPGNLLACVLSVGAYSTGPSNDPTVDDNKGNTWVQAVRSLGGVANSQRCFIYYIENALGGGSHSVTIHFPTTCFASLAIMEVSGVKSSGALNQTSNANGTSTTPSSGSVTTSTDGDFYLGGFETDQPLAGSIATETSPQVWTDIYTQVCAAGLEGISAESYGDGINAAAGSYAATWALGGTAQFWTAVLASFKAAPFVPNTQKKEWPREKDDAVPAWQGMSQRRPITALLPGFVATNSPWEPPFRIRLWPTIPDPEAMHVRRLVPVVALAGTTLNPSAWQPFALRRMDSPEPYAPTPMREPRGIAGFAFTASSVQTSGNSQTGGTSLVLTWPHATTAGNLLVAILGFTDANAGEHAPVDWSTAVRRSDGPRVNRDIIYYIPNAASRSGTETFTFDHACDAIGYLIEFDGIATVSPLDVTADNSSNSSTPAIVSAQTTTNAEDLIVTAFGQTGTRTFSNPSSGFAIEAQTTIGNYSLCWADRIVLVQGSYDPYVTSSGLDRWCAVQAAFKLAPAPASPWVPFEIKQLREPKMPGPPEWEAGVSGRRETSPAILPGPGIRVVIPLLVQFDPAASIRSRRHQQLVTQILNSLILQGQLIETSPTVWALGFVPGDIQDWSSTLPDTVSEALDRLAALLASLNGGIGP